MAFLGTIIFSSMGMAEGKVAVTIKTFVRAETDTAIKNVVGLNTFFHLRGLTPNLQAGCDPDEPIHTLLFCCPGSDQTCNRDHAETRRPLPESARHRPGSLLLRKNQTGQV
jgi:hypothetical protein